MAVGFLALSFIRRRDDSIVFEFQERFEKFRRFYDPKFIEYFIFTSVPNLLRYLLTLEKVDAMYVSLISNCFGSLEDFLGISRVLK